MGKFENDIEHQLSDFRLEASPQVWNDIEAAIQQRRRRRVVGWWWFPLAAIITGVAGWGILQYNRHHYINHKAEETRNSELVAVTAQPNRGEHIAVEADNKPLTAEVFSAGKVDVSSAPNQKSNSTDYIITTNERAINKMAVAGAVHQQPAKAARFLTSSYQQKHAAAFIPSEATSVPMQNYMLPMHEAGGWLSQPIVRVYPKSLSLLSGRQLPLANTQPEHKNTNGQQIPVIKQPAKSRWYLSIGGGGSLITGKSLVQQPDLFNTAPNGVGSSGNPSLTGGGSQPKTYAKPSTGYFLTAGLGYQYALSSRLQLLTGLSYRYLTNNIDTGKTVKNYQHSIQVPLGVQYTINPQAKLKVSVQAGAAITWNLKQQWLATDEIQGYHYNSGLNQKTNTSLFAGLAITNAKGWRLSVQFEQGLQTLQQAPSQPYCSQLVGMHLGLPLR